MWPEQSKRNLTEMCNIYEVLCLSRSPQPEAPEPHAVLSSHCGSVALNRNAVLIINWLDWILHLFKKNSNLDDLTRLKMIYSFVHCWHWTKSKGIESFTSLSKCACQITEQTFVKGLNLLSDGFIINRRTLNFLFYF